MYPISYEADFKAEPDRWTTFFRPILAIPWIIVAIFWGFLFFFTHIAAWIVVTILGRYPQGLYEFNSGVVRYFIRTSSWVLLQTDEWPPFGLKDDPSYPIRVNVPPPAEQQSRAKVFFRFILIIPIAIVASIVSYTFRFIAVAAWLTIVFRGYMPRWFFDTLASLHSIETRVFGYAAFLTDDYPPVGPERAQPVPMAGTPAPPEPPTAPAA